MRHSLLLGFEIYLQSAGWGWRPVRHTSPPMVSARKAPKPMCVPLRMASTNVLEIESFAFFTPEATAFWYPAGGAAHRLVASLAGGGGGTGGAAGS